MIANMKPWIVVVVVLGTVAHAHGQDAVPDGAELRRLIESQLHITRPDYLVFVPRVGDEQVSQTGNEHFIVFDGPDGSLMAIWTQSTREGERDQHIVFSRSDDEGVTWTSPRLIAGPARAGEGEIASWAFPMVSRSGRIYVLYSQHVGKFDSFFHTTGRMDGVYSDDNGQTWSAPGTVDAMRSMRDNPDESFPGNWICWQKPQRLARDGRYLVGVTRWTSRAQFRNPGKSWTSHDSVVEFLRFDDIDDDPEIPRIRFTRFAADEDALTVPHPRFPEVSVCQEASIVKLPDGRLLCVMRTMAGSPHWSQSRDLGETWSRPQALLMRDDGPAIPHPLSPCPIYDVEGDGVASGRYVLFVHHHDGHYQGATPEQTDRHRRPVWLVRGSFVADASQPIWFDEPALFMDHDGTALGAPGSKGRTDLALYSSFTVREGRRVLWYPDRKFFLLGRVIE